MTIGETLRKYRLLAKLTLNEASSSTGIDSSLLGKIERGTRTATKNNLSLLAKAYNIDELLLKKEFITDHIATYIVAEGADSEILKAAEEKVLYLRSNLDGK